MKSTTWVCNYCWHVKLYTFFLDRQWQLLKYLGLVRTIYIRCIYGIVGKKITKYTVIYGEYVGFWPALHS